MSTTTQYNPNLSLNARLLAAGASKTVYAMVTPEVEHIKMGVFGDNGVGTSQNDYLDMFRHAWTGKQDAYHVDFFDKWHAWSAPVVDLDRANFPFYYPCNGASEPIRHLIYKLAAQTRGLAKIHIFNGEYEGYKAMAEAAGLEVVEWDRTDWQTKSGLINRVEWNMGTSDLFFLSQPSAIDGNVWGEFNEFISRMPKNTVVADVTYVGAVPDTAITERFNLNADAIHSVIFSLSKPFGVYYDRIGGIFMREEDGGLFGNRWFKNLTSLAIGSKLLDAFSVFDIPFNLALSQNLMVQRVNAELGLNVKPSDVVILAGGPAGDDELSSYLSRAGNIRICLTPGMVDVHNSIEAN